MSENKTVLVHQVLILDQYDYEETKQEVADKEKFTFETYVNHSLIALVLEGASILKVDSFADLTWKHKEQHRDGYVNNIKVIVTYTNNLELPEEDGKAGE